MLELENQLEAIAAPPLEPVIPTSARRRYWRYPRWIWNWVWTRVTISLVCRTSPLEVGPSGIKF
jgi:hypothetical protein